jgi:hypothetical protein
MMGRFKWAAIAALLLVCAAPAQAGGFTDTDFLKLAQQVQDQGRRIQAQARRIHTLERVNGEQSAKLNWFEQCTPGPLDVGLFLDEELGQRFNTLALATNSPSVTWQGLAFPTGAQTFALQVHPSCIHGSISGFPWGR